MKYDEEKQVKFVREVAEVINRYSLENESNTPDFIIAEHLWSCLLSFNETVQSRNDWYSLTPPQTEREE